MDPLLRRSQPGRTASVARSWEQMSWPFRILRAFLGVTFLYAGIQKLADPNFLHRGTADYIGAQLQAFAHGSPIKSLLSIAVRVPVLTGVVVALTEIAIGLGTLAGIAPIAFAGVGFAVNLILFLSATWHVKPYFLGSDSIYAVAWGAYLVGLVEARRRAARSLHMRGTRRQRQAAAEEIGRREFIRGGVLGIATLWLGAMAFGFEGRESAVADPPLASAPRSVQPSPAQNGSPATQPVGTPIAQLDKVPIGSAVGFNDPAQGPSVLVRLGKEQVVAFSRACTHAGCLVDYDQAARLLVCPCHGAEFDPAHGAEVVAGPAPTPLPEVPVTIDKSTGRVIATS